MNNRCVSPVISVVLMVAISVILSSVVATYVFSVGSENINEPAPFVSDSSGDFEVTDSGSVAGSNQIVEITHIAGEPVDVGELEIQVRATGENLNEYARIVNLPSDGGTIDETNIEGNSNLIDESGYADIIVSDDANTWRSGKTIQFRVATGGADFRPKGDASRLEVSIIHKASNTVISEHEFTK